MMAAAAAAAPPATNGLPFNWFDAVVVLVLGFGLFRGRKNGMSKEFLTFLQWLVLVPVCGLGYPMLAGALTGFIPDKLWSCIAAYMALALTVFIVFAILQRKFAEQLVKSDIFKGGEYYLGMLAGLVRYACVLLFVLALLNARVYTPAEITAQRARDQKNFGGGPGSGFQGNFFPHLFTVQEVVFKESLLGKCVKDNLNVLLINTGQPGAGGAQPPKPQPVIKIGN
jgi:uncharacterized membrane protein required for colicin V production